MAILKRLGAYGESFPQNSIQVLLYRLKFGCLRPLSIFSMGESELSIQRTSWKVSMIMSERKESGKSYKGISPDSRTSMTNSDSGRVGEGIRLILNSCMFTYARRD